MSKQEERDCDESCRGSTGTACHNTELYLQGTTVSIRIDKLSLVNKLHFYSKFASKPVSQPGSEGPTPFTSFCKNGYTMEYSYKGRIRDLCLVMLVEKNTSPKIAAHLI